jgi:8-oxo-dGTP pyrophosphatase MutT (NUDIX family)
MGMAGALIWRETDGRYLLLQRSAERDVGAGQWECVTGRLEQGEGVPDALYRK